MTKTQSFEPDWASAPGETVGDILRERGLSASELADRLEKPVEQIEALLEGRTSFTIELARRLEEVLGGSVEFWMARDYQYREDVARLRSDEENWLNELPLSDMVRFGWLSSEPHPTDELKTCLEFFDVPTVEKWREKYLETPQLAALRTSPSFETQPAALAAWLRQGDIEASDIETQPWDPDQFRETLTAVRGLTRDKYPSNFIPELQNRCAATGVAVVVLPAPSGCRASGATRFLEEDKALLLLSFRHLTDDHFWFTFFHEAGHLALHGKDSLHVEGVDGALSPQEEEEADRFAENILIPPEYRQEMLDLPVNGKKVIRFARKVGISPGIVVGQLQHHGKIDYDTLNGLKRRYSWDVDEINLRNA